MLAEPGKSSAISGSPLGGAGREYKRFLFGQIAVDLEFIQHEQLMECLKLQSRPGTLKHLGEIFLDQGFMTQRQIDQILELQSNRLEEAFSEINVSDSGPTVEGKEPVDLHRVLVMDDSATVRYFVKMSLQDKCDVALTTCGTEALVRLNDTSQPPYELLILDIEVPGDMSGFELARQLRKIDRYGNVPILFLSMLTGEEVEREANELGTCLLSKPDHRGLNEFRKLVRSYLLKSA